MVTDVTLSSRSSFREEPSLYVVCMNKYQRYSTGVYSALDKYRAVASMLCLMFV